MPPQSHSNRLRRAQNVKTASTGRPASRVVTVWTTTCAPRTLDTVHTDVNLAMNYPTVKAVSCFSTLLMIQLSYILVLCTGRQWFCLIMAAMEQKRTLKVLLDLRCYSHKSHTSMTHLYEMNVFNVGYL